MTPKIKFRKGICIITATGYLLLNGCAVPKVARPASDYLLSTDRSTSKVVLDTKAALIKHKYQIQKEDITSGILVVAPRKFTYRTATQKIEAEQRVQIRVDGGSVKINIMYKCKYNSLLEACDSADKDGNIKIKRLERALLEIINPLLKKEFEKKTIVEDLDSQEDQEKSDSDK